MATSQSAASSPPSIDKEAYALQTHWPVQTGGGNETSGASAAVNCLTVMIRHILSHIPPNRRPASHESALLQRATRSFSGTTDDLRSPEGEALLQHLYKDTGVGTEGGPEELTFKHLVLSTHLRDSFWSWELFLLTTDILHRRRKTGIQSSSDADKARQGGEEEEEEEEDEEEEDEDKGEWRTFSELGILAEISLVVWDEDGNMGLGEHIQSLFGRGSVRNPKTGLEMMMFCRRPDFIRVLVRPRSGVAESWASRLHRLREFAIPKTPRRRSWADKETSLVVVKASGPVKSQWFYRLIVLVRLKDKEGDHASSDAVLLFTVDGRSITPVMPPAWLKYALARDWASSQAEDCEIFAVYARVDEPLPALVAVGEEHEKRGDGFLGWAPIAKMRNRVKEDLQQVDITHEWDWGCGLPVPSYPPPERGHGQVDPGSTSASGSASAAGAAEKAETEGVQRFEADKPMGQEQEKPGPHGQQQIQNDLALSLPPLPSDEIRDQYYVHPDRTRMQIEGPTSGVRGRARKQPLDELTGWGPRLPLTSSPTPPPSAPSGAGEVAAGQIQGGRGGNTPLPPVRGGGQRGGQRGGRRRRKRRKGRSPGSKRAAGLERPIPPTEPRADRERRERSERERRGSNANSGRHGSGANSVALGQRQRSNGP